MYLEIANFICNAIVASATIIATFLAFRSFIKRKRYNLTSTSIIIIDDIEKDCCRWYLKIQLKNCQQTIRCIDVEIFKPFSIISCVAEKVSDSFFISSNYESNIIKLSNVNNDDSIFLCLSIDRSTSNSILKQMDKIQNFNHVFRIISSDIQLQKGLFSYSQIYYA